MVALRTVSEDRAEQFDYAQLSPGEAAEIREVAVRVRAAHERTIVAVLEMGRDLLAVKARLGHGRFGAWLHAEFGGVARTAQNYMMAAQAFAGKGEMVSYLPAATVYALAAPSTPKAVRSEIVCRLEAGERPHPAAITEAVRAARTKARESRPAPTTAAAATPTSDRDDTGHILAVSELITTLRIALSEDLGRVRELLGECRPGWTVAELAQRL